MTIIFSWAYFPFGCFLVDNDNDALGASGVSEDILGEGALYEAWDDKEPFYWSFLNMVELTERPGIR